MEATQLPIKEVKCTHSGQYHAYGDSFTVMDKKDRKQQEFEDWIEGQLEWLAEVHLGR